MQFAGDAFPFSLACLHSCANLGGQLPHAQQIKQPQNSNNGSGAKNEKPVRLEKGGSQVELDRGAHLVPNVVVVAGHYTEAVFPGRKITVESLPAELRVLPSRVVPFELIAKTNFLWNDKAKRGVVDLEAAR